MFEQIDPRSATPLYAQIAGRLRVAVAAGELRPGEPLPSVRQLASKLRVNPATVVQAYRDLETEGFVEMRQGAGTFVKEVVPERKATERSKQAIDLVRQMIAEAGRLGLTARELQQAIEQELEARIG
ncbi:MAG TPA: GntR family transcriptional regulator [Gemmatimonadales bacterium]|nr:GntR family transcriptional regulator [Gemmatimonadales bacterium]HKR55132.1 GntR family transcriptional regulator [Gemmatimonadales bacterium]HWH04471.1 GntR family transcriptional regulator [Gemmatimonadales bacterium]